MNSASCSIVFCPHSAVFRRSLMYLPMLQYSLMSSWLVVTNDLILGSFDEGEDFGELGL
jgi:hypothetical protein